MAPLGHGDSVFAQHVTNHLTLCIPDLTCHTQLGVFRVLRDRLDALDSSDVVSSANEDA